MPHHHYLSTEGVKNLLNYKGGVTVDKGITYVHFISPLCNVLVEYLPRNLAPNLMTFSGFIFNALAYWICFTYLSDGKPEPWNWVPLAAAALTAAYMLADAMDGKQARRTGNSSVLGELMDHTVDALFIQFGTCSIAHCIGLSTEQVFWAVVVGIGAFYLAHWEELYAEHLVLGPLTGPTELLLATIIVYLATYVFGHSLWDTHAFSVDAGPALLQGDYNFRTLVFHVIVGGAAVAGLSSFWNGMKLAGARGLSPLSALRPMVPFLIYAAAAAVWMRASWEHYLSSQLAAHMYIHCLGTLFTYICGRVILGRIGQSQAPWFHLVQLPLIAVAVDAAFFHRLSQDNATFIVGFFAVLQFLHFAVNVSLQIVDIQNTYVFRVGKAT